MRVHQQPGPDVVLSMLPACTTGQFLQTQQSVPLVLSCPMVLPLLLLLHAAVLPLQSRLRRQTNTDWAEANALTAARPDSPAMDDGTPTAAGKPCNSRGSKGAAAGAASWRGSYGTTQMHDSRGRFMSHAAAQLLASGFTSTPTASAARQRSVGRDAGGMLDGADTSQGATPAASDGPGYSTPRGCAAAAADADGAMSDVSSDVPLVLSESSLGGTTGQPGRAGRCAVCVVQRKGKCGTESAPKKCLRRQLQEQQQAERAKKAAPILSVAAAASAVAIAAAEAEALAAARNSPCPKVEPTAAAAVSALARVAAEAEALAAARSSPAPAAKPADTAPAATAAGSGGQQQPQQSNDNGSGAENAPSCAAAAETAAAAPASSGEPVQAQEDQTAAAQHGQVAVPCPAESTAAAAAASSAVLQQEPGTREAVQVQPPLQRQAPQCQQPLLQPHSLGPFQRLLMSDAASEQEAAATCAGQALAPVAAPSEQQHAAGVAALQQHVSATQHMGPRADVVPQQHQQSAGAQHPPAVSAAGTELLQLLQPHQPAAPVQVVPATMAQGAPPAATAPAASATPLSAVKQELVQQC